MKAAADTLELEAVSPAIFFSRRLLEAKPAAWSVNLFASLGMCSNIRLERWLALIFQASSRCLKTSMLLSLNSPAKK